MSSQMSHICQNWRDLSIFTPPIGPPNFEVEQQVDTLNCWDPWGIFEESAGRCCFHDEFSDLFLLVEPQTDMWKFWR